MSVNDENVIIESEDITVEVVNNDLEVYITEEIKGSDVVVEVPNNPVEIYLTDYIAFWSSIVGDPSENAGLVSYLNTLLAKKQDLTYFVVATEQDKGNIPDKKTGTVAFVKESKNLYIYYAEGTTTEWILLIRDLSNYYTKPETDALLALKANIADVYSKIDADARFATITGLENEATIRYNADSNLQLSKQDKLTAGKNITIQGNVISATSKINTEWGKIEGDIEDQTDLQEALNEKQGNLTAGSNIEIDSNNTIKTITYVHEQGVASETWEIVHNLNKFPSVTIIDSAWNEVTAKVTYIDENTCTISMNASFKGKAYLN